MAKLLDQYGDPIDLSVLNQEISAPSLGGVRSVWTETVLSGLDPIGMGEVLRQAARGWPDRFFALAEEMEERDLHYGSVLGTRKRAITGIEPMIVAASEDAQDEKIADAVRDMINIPEFVDDYLSDLLDALGKGYSVVETIWDRQAREWRPVQFKWRDPRHFLIDQTDGRTLRLKDTLTTAGVDLPPYKFSIHKPKLKSGLPIRGGLARLAAWGFLFKSYTLKDWMAFLEVFGMPLRVGRYGKGASHDEKRVLLQAVRGISTDAAAIIPKDMEIEFIEVGGSAGNGLFSAKAEYLDKQISKGVLGQTMTSDDGASLSQAQIHENVRHDIARADARQLAVTVNRDLIRPFVDLNFGQQERYPTFVIKVTANEDIKALADVVSKLVPLGLEISMSKVRERIGFDTPDEKDTLLHAPKATPKTDLPTEKETPTPPVPKPKPQRAETALRPSCSHCGGIHALAAVQVEDQDELDKLVALGLDGWEKAMTPLVSPLEKAFADSTSYEDLKERLEDAQAKMDGEAFADHLAKLLMKARGLGDIGEA